MRCFTGPHRRIPVALLSLLFGTLLAQEPQEVRHHSPLEGTPVSHPESLSGLWEAPDGQGGAIGIHLQLMTTVPADIKRLRGISQSWFSLVVGVYQRHGAVAQARERNYFIDWSADSAVHFEHGRLRLHSVPSRTFLLAVDLDLVQQTDSSWEGRFHRGNFDSRVKLQRPGAGRQFSRDPVVGTWSENLTDVPVRSCVHIVQQTATEWTGWSDSLTLPGLMQYAPHVSRPATAEERYGELMNVERKQNGSFSFELGPLNGICCPHRFAGTLTSSGTQIQGAWLAGPNQIARQGRWTKMPGDSCISGEQTVDVAEH